MEMLGYGLSNHRIETAKIWSIYRESSQKKIATNPRFKSTLLVQSLQIVRAQTREAGIKSVKVTLDMAYIG